MGETQALAISIHYTEREMVEAEENLYRLRKRLIEMKRDYFRLRNAPADGAKPTESDTTPPSGSR